MSRKSKAEEFVDDKYDVVVTGRNVLVTDAMKNYAIEKVSKIDRFGHRVVDVNVTMDIQKIEHRVDIMLKIDNTLIKSSAATEDMYISIDRAVDKLMEQIRRFKTRVCDHQSIGHADVAMNVNVYTPLEELQEYNDEIEEENIKSLIERFKPHKIVSQETRPLKTLNLNEALLKFELSGEPFLLFRGEEDRKLKVIYKRNDGNFGVIEPE